VLCTYIHLPQHRSRTYCALRPWNRSATKSTQDPRRHTLICLRTLGNGLTISSWFGAAITGFCPILVLQSTLLLSNFFLMTSCSCFTSDPGFVFCSCFFFFFFVERPSAKTMSWLPFHQKEQNWKSVEDHLDSTMRSWSLVEFVYNAIRSQPRTRREDDAPSPLLIGNFIDILNCLK